MEDDLLCEICPIRRADLGVVERSYTRYYMRLVFKKVYGKVEDIPEVQNEPKKTQIIESVHGCLEKQGNKTCLVITE